jgi:NodT family efflux transporter outer membrane factor (OMF) lipoprotein
MSRRIGAGVVIAALLAGCMPAERERPQLSTVVAPADWLDGGSGTAAVDARWWQAFGDPTLTSLVETALARNTDVLAAAARVQEAEANVRLARSTLLPAVDVALPVQRSRSVVEGASPTAATVLQPQVQVNWQVDVFGRLSKLTDAARLQYRASRADREAIALAVTSQVAQTYVGLLALDAQLFVSRETVESRREALRLAQDQAQVGYISQFELTQAQSEFEAVEQVVPQILLAIRAQENAIRVLTGDMPASVLRGNSLDKLALPTVPATLPSDLLRRRPDLASAELAVAAADANLAADRRAFLPQVNLTASAGALMVNLLDYDPQAIWSIGGSVLAPIFQGGRLRAQVDASTALRDQAAFAYRGTALAAFQEVETSLTGIRRFEEQFARVINRRNILLRSVAMSSDRYQSGFAAYIEQLDAQRNLYSVELEAITLRRDQINNVIQLYRALGGGWSADGLR